MLDVRRLAAVDMHGVAGTRRRQSIIRAEFFLGAVGSAALGIWVAVAATTVGWQLFGAWIIGIGVSYAALAWQAVLLSRPGGSRAGAPGCLTTRLPTLMRRARPCRVRICLLSQ